MLQKLTKLVMESALDGELDDHLGYDKHDPAGRDGGNSRNGQRSKTLWTEAGPVEISVPRDRDGSFEPRIVAKRQRRLVSHSSCPAQASIPPALTAAWLRHLLSAGAATSQRAGRCFCGG